MPELGRTFTLCRQGPLYGVLCNFYERANSFTAEQGRMLWPHVVTAAGHAKKLEASQAERYCRQCFPSLWSLVEKKPVPSVAPITPEPPDQSIEARLLRLEQSVAQIVAFLKSR
jgi:hypothetical protein